MQASALDHRERVCQTSRVTRARPASWTGPLTLALSLAIVGSAHGERDSARRVALLPLEAVNLQPAEVARYRSALVDKIQKRAYLRLVPAASVKAARAAESNNCGRDPACLTRIGRATRADVVLAARIGRLGDTVVVQLSAFDVAAGARQGRWEEVLKRASSAAVDRALARMVVRFAPPPAPPEPPVVPPLVGLDGGGRRRRRWRRHRDRRQQRVQRPLSGRRRRLPAEVASALLSEAVEQRVEATVGLGVLAVEKGLQGALRLSRELAAARLGLAGEQPVDAGQLGLDEAAADLQPRHRLLE